MINTLRTASTERPAFLRRAWLWMVLGGVFIAALALVDVTITGPRVAVRWGADVRPADRAALEERYDLRNGEPDQGALSTQTWRYELGDRSRENIRALVNDPAVDDTAYINRDALRAEDPNVRISIRPLPRVSSLPFPFSTVDNQFEDPWQLFQLQSLWLLLAGAAVLWGARATSERRRRNVTAAALILVGVLAVAFPIDPLFVRMGEANDHVGSRERFESYFGGRVRYEKHLSQTILLQLYLRSEPTDAAPERALITVSRGATAWFVLSALAIGFLERWSAVVLRYLGLALLAPSALLYFGWWEFGYLSLNVAAFPLLLCGLRDGGMRLEAGSALAGFGAALHGSGLVSLTGAWLAALGASARLRDRVGRALRVAAWGTAAYLGWIAVYVIVLKLRIDPGDPAANPWRPWFVNAIREQRVSAAILSATTARDLSMTAWVVGAPLLLVAASLWRKYANEVRTVFWYSLPSIVFEIARWPVRGIGSGMDLLAAGFPALYGLTWVCAHDEKRTKVAAALLVSAHLAFWRVVLDEQFQTVRID